MAIRIQLTDNTKRWEIPGVTPRTVLRGNMIVELDDPVPKAVHDRIAKGFLTQIPMGELPEEVMAAPRRVPPPVQVRHRDPNHPAYARFKQAREETDAVRAVIGAGVGVVLGTTSMNPNAGAGGELLLLNAESMMGVKVPPPMPRPGQETGGTVARVIRGQTPAHDDLEEETGTEPEAGEETGTSPASTAPEGATPAPTGPPPPDDTGARNLDPSKPSGTTKKHGAKP